MSDLRTGFFTYPWDLISEAPENVIDLMIKQNKCNAIMVNTNYHHARLLRPRSIGPKTLQYDQAIFAFKPQLGLYVESGLIPVVDEALANSNVLAITRDACRSRDMDFGVWVVGLHNSSIGEQNPDLCVVNCFGDVYSYSLCPSQIRNHQYLLGLVRDVCSQFMPNRVLVEAIGSLGLKHWVHHELFMTEWDEGLEMLTSICFCPACIQRGLNIGLDVNLLRNEVARWANNLLNDERGSLPLEFRLADVPSMLLEIDGLWSYLMVCARAVTDLAAGLHKVVLEFGVALEISPSSFHRPVSRAWIERLSLKSLSEVCDRLLVSSYFSSSSEVEADLRWASYLAPSARLSAGINACAPTQSAASVEAQATACVTAGCDGVYYYNYGLLNQKRLNWVTQANNSILNV